VSREKTLHARFDSIRSSTPKNKKAIHQLQKTLRRWKNNKKMGKHFFFLERKRSKRPPPSKFQLETVAYFHDVRIVFQVLT
jgi:hypothetical protein